MTNRLFQPDDDLRCDLCERTATHGVQMELAIGDDGAEADCLELCGPHYDQHVVSTLALCRTAALSKPDESALAGELDVTAYDLNTDEDLGRWRLCSEHGLPLWALAPQPPPC